MKASFLATRLPCSSAFRFEQNLTDLGEEMIMATLKVKNIQEKDAVKYTLEVGGASEETLRLKQSANMTFTTAGRLNL